VRQLGQVQLLLFLDRLDLVEMPFGAAFVRHHAQPRGFSLAFRLLHVRQIGLKGLNQTVVARRNGRKVTDTALKIAVRI